ncbi:serine/threonine-protein kinase TBK1-like [Pecten maximus]|uniref:serine/threonine-protein kinase TBK1-like n=1 Tax=Pecten maximus TaxID=6579 RepID=UPI0014584FBB|nr:serine/threonine-protein kinase TBK1-like [Pecten maximus]XP_033744504.1 serine/threonine-protein kinase TBK1-like [Pecten maximus]XP_033744505.1 serine/threonine-protein kinase TBK1-like [Pecten maximus]XP_033744506.1 serine/threonine-protein kinase TBK1-like [Pecten maximus]XP_033744507.1 serine/threonine-protein kinase TBK1-like [Pecten maximus]XP_033744508.1 serine/threonine-protein kinase TBK1-like [Pecten maximus]XP_033744509.1 serine/threonine-protein kinase TBK1-like [Pecten maximu
MAQSTLRGSKHYMWDVTKMLGQGATSKVYRGRNKITGEEVAVKVFTSAAALRPFEVQMREYSLMKKMDHINIVKMQDLEQEIGTGNKVIIMELSTCGSLYNMLDDPKNAYGLEETEFLLVLNHVAKGMKYLHEKGIVHRDVKPGNILCYKGEDGRFVFKLTDFGAAKELQYEEEQFVSLYGTEEYLHPDIYGCAVMRDKDKEKVFDATVDLWSLGVTIFHAATGRLPFRPFGGRKNRVTMYEITKSKEPGYISGIQQSENGKIEWSKELPLTCRLSLGLKMFLTPILAGLLERNDRYKLSFGNFFTKVDKLMSKIIIHTFSPNTWMHMRIYIDGNSKITQLQDYIAEQSDIAIQDQVLIHDGDLLNNIVDNMMSVTHFPKSVFSEKTPIFVFTKHSDDQRAFPKSWCPDFPKFGNSINISNDHQMAKMCCGIHFLLCKEMGRYHMQMDLERLSVQSYIHELKHECSHLLSYDSRLRDHCATDLTMLNNFIQESQQKILILSAVHTVEPSKLVALQEKTNARIRELQSTADNIRHELKRTKKDLSNYQEKINRKELERSWDNAIGCNNEGDRCKERQEVTVEIIQRIVRHFKEHRQAQYLSRTEEDIHAFERNQLEELCIKAKSLIETCDSRGQRQYEMFHRFYSKAVSTREENDSLDRALASLEKIRIDFEKHLSEVVAELGHDCRKVLESSQTDPLRSRGSKQNLTNGIDRDTRRNLLTEANISLKSGFEDLKGDIQRNNDLLKMSGEILEELKNTSPPLILNGGLEKSSGYG